MSLLVTNYFLLQLNPVSTMHPDEIHQLSWSVYNTIYDLKTIYDFSSVKIIAITINN